LDDQKSHDDAAKNDIIAVRLKNANSTDLEAQDATVMFATTQASNEAIR